MPEFGRIIPGFLKKSGPTSVSSETSILGITPEVARADIEKMLAVFATLGQGNDIDRAAQMVLQSLQVLNRRLDNQGLLKILYLNNPNTAGMLPRVATDTVTKLCSGEITPDKAREIIDGSITLYVGVFEAMGVKPATISVLFPGPTDKKQ